MPRTRRRPRPDPTELVDDLGEFHDMLIVFLKRLSGNVGPDLIEDACTLCNRMRQIITDIEDGTERD